MFYPCNKFATYSTITLEYYVYGLPLMSNETDLYL